MPLFVVNKYHNGNNISSNNSNIYIGRGSILGNPYTHLPVDKTKAEYQVENRHVAIEKYEEYLKDKIKNNDKEIIDELNRIMELAIDRRIQLVCFCKPAACHGDVIKKVIAAKMKVNKKF